MSLPSPEPETIPEETARLARTINPKGTLYMQIRDHLGVVYENHSFACLFSTRGHLLKRHGGWLWFASFNSSKG